MARGNFTRCRGLERFATPSFARSLEASRTMLTRDAAMFREFTGANPFFPEALAELQACLEQASAGGLETVSDLAASWYAGHGNEA
jgi:prephenate dehydrogenase